MTTRKNIAFMFGLLITVFFFHAQSVANAKNRDRYFESLQKSLIKDGFDKNIITQLYNRPQVYFEGKGVSRFLVHSEAKLNYNQFASNKSIHNALIYMEKYKKELAKAEEAYGVNGEIITAIILVETRLGTILGGPSILNTLSTMASLADLDVRDMFWGTVSRSTSLTRKQFEKWVKRKSKWAYNELKAFLKYTAAEKIDPASISGSYSGAMGIAQFMPSNILALARDGDGDERIDLFNHADAITSIASYLKHYGWHAGIGRKKAYQVIYHYNHSRQYVDAVLKVAERLKPKA
jgi:membrane-bound lytic murein transglycosylase B